MATAEPGEHDYVVVGAGSAGSVIVRRLLDQGHSVHVLEAGPRDDDPLIGTPQAWPGLLGGDMDWAVPTVPQAHANDRSIVWPRGKVLGGSSSINGMIYVRGHRSDYDSWAYAGCPGWDWESVLPLFKRSEDHVDGARVVYPADSYPVPEHGYTIAPGIVRPLSRGTLRLASADPEISPLVDPAMLAESYDLEALVDAVEICREIGASPAFAEWRKVEVAPGPDARTRADLRDYVRRAVSTYQHQVGTCRMGLDSMSVVDPSLRVHGVSGLRIADASIMPAVPSGNTNAPSIMIGEKASDLILGGAK